MSKLFNIKHDDDVCAVTITVLGISMSFRNYKKYAKKLRVVLDRVKRTKQNLEKRNEQLKERNEQLTKQNGLLSKENEDLKLISKSVNKSNKIKARLIRIILYLWQTENVNESFSSISSLLLEDSACNKAIDGKISLMLMTSFLNTNQKEKAVEVFRPYYEQHGLLDIECFLPVANMAFEMNLYDEKIETSNYVYKAFLENRQNNILKEMLENKRIAVVGNGPSEIGKNQGSEIDSHDIVIRFNNYRTEGFEADYGSKTDIWCINPGNDIVYRDYKQYKLIISPNNYSQYYIKNFAFTEYLASAQKDGVNILSSSREVKDFQFSVAPHLWGTIGFNLIMELYYLLGSLNNVDFYGFNFCKEIHDNYCTHYFNDRDADEGKQKSMVHDLLQETDVLKKLINGGKINEKII